MLVLQIGAFVEFICATIGPFSDSFIVWRFMMIKASAKFTVFLFVVLIVAQWVFRSRIDWLEAISISILGFLFHYLFEWIERKEIY